MTPLIIIKCKTKILQSIMMVIFGIIITLVGVGGLVKGGSYWWLLGLLLGTFCIYIWTGILINGSRSIGMLVKEETLYVSFEKTKKMVVLLEDFKNGDFHTASYNLNELSHFWKYKLKINGGTSNEELKIQYKNKKEVMIDLSRHEVILSDDDLDKLIQFLYQHKPSIIFAKP